MSGCRHLWALRDPPAVSPCAPPRLFLSRNPANSSPDRGCARPRLLGFGPGHQPCLADRRPRYSFCAQGRATALTDPAMGFYPLPGLWRAAPVLLPEPIRSWALRDRPDRVCSGATGRIACPSASFKPSTPTRSSGVPAATELLHEVLAPALRRSPNFTGPTGSRRCMRLDCVSFHAPKSVASQGGGANRNELLLDDTITPV